MTSETDTTGSAFDVGKPFMTRDGRKVTLNDQITGRVVSDPCPQFDWRLNGRHMWGNRDLDLINVASTPVEHTPADRDDTHGVGDETDAAFLERMASPINRSRAGDYMTMVENERFDRLIALARRGAAIAQPTPEPERAGDDGWRGSDAAALSVIQRLEATPNFHDNCSVSLYDLAVVCDLAKQSLKAAAPRRN